MQKIAVLYKHKTDIETFNAYYKDIVYTVIGDRVHAAARL